MRICSQFAFASILRNNVLLTPTVHCLINVIEYPFFVMSLDDVQIAYFERVQFSLRAFDLVFIFNDWTQKEVHVNSIPVESLETIKDWLDSCNIKYYQGPTNLNWRGLLDLASNDPKKFWADGGWSVLDNSTESGDDQDAAAEGEAQGNGEVKTTTMGDDYRPSASDESDYDLEDSSVEEEGGRPPRILDEDEEVGAPVSKEPDGGLDWDELEERAGKHDLKAANKRQKGPGTYDSDEERKERERLKRQRRK